MSGHQTLLRTVVAAQLAAAASCAALEPPSDLKAPPDLTLHQVVLRQFKGGQPTALATLDTVEYVRDTGHIESHGGVLWPVTGSMAGGTLHTGHAAGSTRTGKAQLSEGVVWTTPGGDRMETSACAVDLVDQIARGQEPVTMQGKGYRLSAGGFESRYGAGEAQFHDGVHVTMAESTLGNPSAAGESP